MSDIDPSHTGRPTDPIELAQIMRDEKDADRHGTSGYFEKVHHPVTSIAHKLTHQQYERCEVEKIYSENLRMLGENELADELDRLGAILVDSSILSSPGFTQNEALIDLYALELSSFYGNLQKRFYDTVSRSQNGEELDYVDNVVIGVYGTFFEKNDGTIDREAHDHGIPSLIDTCKRILASAKVGRINDQNRRNQRIRNRAKGMRPIVRVIKGEDGKADCVYLDDELKQPRLIGSVTLKDLLTTNE